MTPFLGSILMCDSCFARKGLPCTASNTLRQGISGIFLVQTKHRWLSRQHDSACISGSWNCPTTCLLPKHVGVNFDKIFPTLCWSQKVEQNTTTNSSMVGLRPNERRGLRRFNQWVSEKFCVVFVLMLVRHVFECQKTSFLDHAGLTIWDGLQFGVWGHSWPGKRRSDRGELSWTFGTCRSQLPIESSLWKSKIRCKFYKVIITKLMWAARGWIFRQN